MIYWTVGAVWQFFFNVAPMPYSNSEIGIEVIMKSKKLSGRRYALKMIDVMAPRISPEKADKPPAQTLFKAQKKESTVDIVINSIRELLFTRQLSPGQKIPSEAEISEGLGVSRGSVREAMKILAAFGVVEIKVGDGTYIPKEPKAALIDPLLFSFMIYTPDAKEVLEFRKLIELDVVELIIAHKERNAEERKMLQENMEELALLHEKKAGAGAVSKNDMNFHRIMGRAAHNTLIKRVYDFALDYLESTIINTHHSQDNGTKALEVHSQILTAINENDIELAKKAIEYSVEVWDELH